MDSLKQFAKKVFTWQARLVLLRYKPKIIAITGSVGKTSTREAIYAVLSKKYFVRKSGKSFTTELGIPLTIIGCAGASPSLLQWAENIWKGFMLLLYKNTYPEWLILEIDGDKPGDVLGITSFLNPDMLVVTAIGETPSHIELFPSIQEFLSEKKALVDAVTREGCVIYNIDDYRTANLVEDASARKISCGTETADVKASTPQILYGNAGGSEVPTGMSFNVSYKENNHPVTLFGSLGIHNTYASLLAFAVGVELGLTPDYIISALSKRKSLPGRMNIIAGVKDTIILDDSYNSSPVAVSQALEVLKDMKSSGRKIAVLGDMMELGRFTVEEHKKLAEDVKESADRIICVGIRARKIGEELLALGFSEDNILSVDSAEEAGRELQGILQAHDVVLIKGSQSMRMEKVVEEVMRHPEDAKKLLVRQEEEWRGR